MSIDFEIFLAKAIRNYLRMEAMFAENQVRQGLGHTPAYAPGSFDAVSTEVNKAYDNFKNPKL